MDSEAEEEMEEAEDEDDEECDAVPCILRRSLMPTMPHASDPLDEYPVPDTELPSSSPSPSPCPGPPRRLPALADPEPEPAAEPVSDKSPGMLSRRGSPAGLPVGADWSDATGPRRSRRPDLGPRGGAVPPIMRESGIVSPPSGPRGARPS